MYSRALPGSMQDAIANGKKIVELAMQQPWPSRAEWLRHEVQAVARFAISQPTVSSVLSTAQLRVFAAAIEESLMMAAAWCFYGYPRVALGSHTFAAALVCSDVPEDADIRYPFPCFELVVPNKLLPDFNGLPAADRVWILDGNRFGADLIGYDGRISSETPDDPDSMVLLWCAGRLRGGQATSISEMKRDARNPKTPPPEAAIRALVLNTCLQMADTSTVTARGGPHHERSGMGALDLFGTPETKDFVTGRPVQVNCRQAIRDWFAHNKGGPRKVRWLRRGHWTNQAHGEGRSLRRLQWIEPHWCGREGAPILVRPHVLGDKNDD